MTVGRQKKDFAVSIAKGSIGMIPGIGPLVAEVVGILIPNQRIDRLEDFVKLLNERVSGIEDELLKKKLTTPESIDLLEDAFHQAARALSKQRKEYIASLIKNSLTDDERGHIQYKRLLSILSELNDVEVLLLKLNSLDVRERQEFYRQHKEVLEYSGTISISPWEANARDTFLRACKAHLIRLGLIEDSYISPLGGLLLKSIDQGAHIGPS